MNIKFIRNFVQDFYNEENRLLDRPKCKFINPLISDRSVRLFRLLVEVFMYTDYFREVTREYIKNNYITAEGLKDKLKLNVTVSTIYVIFFLDIRKLENDIDVSELKKLIIYGGDASKKFEEDVLKLYMSYYSRNIVKEKFVVDNSSNEYLLFLENVDRNTLNKAVRILKKYRKDIIKKNFNSIPNEYWKYLFMILDSPNNLLNDDELKIKKDLLDDNN